MLKQVKTENTCINCRFFSQHYSKQGTSYKTVNCGHCLNHNNKNKFSKCPIKICDFWEDITIKKEERKKSIKDTLEFMSERLNEIAIILKDDNE